MNEAVSTQNRKLISAEELAKAFGWRVRRVTWLRDEKRIPYVKLGDFRQSRVVYDLEEVKAWLATRRQESVTDTKVRRKAAKIAGTGSV